MMNNAMILCVLVGLLWGAAPLIGRLSSASAMTMSVLVAVGTLVATLPVAFSQNYAAVGLKAIVLALVAGIANGVGLLFFYRLVAGANEGLWEMSKTLAITSVIMPVVLVIGARLFYSEAITVDKIIGLVLACAAIWFLK